uniref:Uncharacterized protein n=1 Tax=Cucumis melo TaxID=3656 RepID=A0A9I9EEE8_CUCME
GVQRFQLWPPQNQFLLLSYTHNHSHYTTRGHICHFSFQLRPLNSQSSTRPILFTCPRLHTILYRTFFISFPQNSPRYFLLSPPRREPFDSFRLNPR